MVTNDIIPVTRTHRYTLSAFPQKWINKCDDWFQLASDIYVKVCKLVCQKNSKTISFFSLNEPLHEMRSEFAYDILNEADLVENLSNFNFKTALLQKYFSSRYMIYLQVFEWWNWP